MPGILHTDDSALSPLTEEPERLDPYAERILEAARALLLEHGLRRTSLADIARAAGVSEATLFRRFANRDELLRTLLAREAQAFIARVDERISALEDPEERLVTAFLVFAHALREHDLVRRLLVTDPETVLPQITTGGGPIIALARRYLTAQAQRIRDAGAELTADPEHIAEILARLAHSIVLTRETTLPMDDDERLAELVRATLAPLAISRPATKRRPASSS